MLLTALYLGAAAAWVARLWLPAYTCATPTDNILEFMVYD